MSINLSIPSKSAPDLKPRIVVIGIGGAGGNAVNNMIDCGLEGVEFVVANTDAQALTQSGTERRIQLGINATQGLGAGSHPEVGRVSAEESLDQIVEAIEGANMAFLAAGMGGGTGTGAAPVIAQVCREKGILTVGVVTKPFSFEGAHRMRIAEDGITELGQYVDTLIVIPNQNLFRIANEKTTFADAFNMADDVLLSGVRGVTDLMVMPGLINLDFADIRSVMSEMGKAMMGTGEAEGERRALDAAEAAISNPLLDDASMKGAKGVLINIVGGTDMTLFEVDEAANRIRSEVESDAFINFGAIFDPNMEGKIRVSVVATGIDSAASASNEPRTLNIPAEASGSGILDSLRKTPEKTETGTPAEVTHAESVMAEPVMVEPVKPEPETATGNLDHEPVETTQPATGHTSAGQGSAPVGAPSAGAEDPFIPPAPVEKLFGGNQGSADPYAAAAMTNGAGAPKDISDKQQSVKSLSLFERVTGTRRNSKPTPPETQLRTPRIATVAAPEPQTRLGGMDPEERLAPSQPEDDLLDIPAFLRRQAN